MTKLRSTRPYLVMGTQGYKGYLAEEYRGTARVQKWQPLPIPTVPLPMTHGRLPIPLPIPTTDPAEHAMKSLTCCQANRTRVVVKALRIALAAPDMKSLTDCEANRNRVAVKAVRTDPTAPDIKSLTDCQANRSRGPVKASVLRSSHKTAKRPPTRPNQTKQRPDCSCGPATCKNIVVAVFSI